MAPFYKLSYRLLISITAALCVGPACAQKLLDKKVNAGKGQQPAATVLNSISKQGGFYFSYNSDLIPQGKIVNLTGGTQTVRQVLDQVFSGKYKYKERDNYIIIQDGDAYTISGYVVDKTTGAKISYASVYEKQLLASTLTNEEGYFKLKLKDKDQYPTAAISISKGMYTDTLMYLKTGFDQTLNVSIEPKDYVLDSIVVKPEVEKTWLAKLFLSSKQRFQAMNIGSYIAQRPIQASFVPGIGTHGKMGAQVVNKFSLNVLGGYTAGAEGAEIGGLFNIDKGQVGYVQLAGLFNAVGGGVQGLQVAGLYNVTLDTLRGAQIAGLGGMVSGKMEGSQISGLYSHVTGTAEGSQVAGIANLATDNLTGVQVGGFGSIGTKGINGTQVGGFFNYAGNVKGIQVSGFCNLNTGEMKGLQVSGFLNYTKVLKGTQVGIINIADSSDGYSIGLVNVVIKDGYHKLSLYTNEVLNTNIAFKTGTRKLYSILTVGANIEKNKKAYGLYYGLGKETGIYRKLALNTEITGGIIYVGDWRQTASIIHIVPELNFRFSKYLSIHAGPTFAAYYQNATQHIEGYKASIPGYKTYPYSTYGSVWIGWQAGIDIF